MRICVDLTSLADNFSGIERFALSITKELIKNDDHQWILLFKNSIHKELNVDSENIQKIVIKGNNKLIFNQLILPLQLVKIKADKYFFPAFPAPFFFFNKNAISAIHDLGCWDCSASNKKHMTIYFKLMYWKACLGDKKIITVSKFSKDRIHSILHKDNNEILVVYNGLSDNFRNFDYVKTDDYTAKANYKLPEKYILCLSTLEPRKNLKLLVNAYDELIRENKIDLDLVLAGRKGWMMDNFLDNIPSSTVNRIYFTGFIDDKLLPYVYKNAMLFVFPSIYEGFGIPPIESLSMGVPVFSSDAASLPEVLKDSSIYFKSNDKEDLKTKIENLVTDIENGKKIDFENLKSFARQYSWEKEARRLQQWILNGGEL